MIKFIMLVGLPGSGKSTFSELFKTCPLKVKVINQDTMGRQRCEQAIGKSVKDNDITILDRTNFSVADRKKWLDLSMLLKSQCICVFLNMDKDMCIDRADNRTNHPTIKHGSARIINSVHKELVVPTTEEGFSDVIELTSIDDVHNYLKTWNCVKTTIDDDTFIHKFPRTQHIFDLGSATADDKILSTDDSNKFYNCDNVSICEKVDGAQLGLSLDDNYGIQAQNRAHYVNSSDKQFKKLGKWITDHSSVLYDVLDKDTILFGEWLYAKHSVLCNLLPSYFIAFDIYSKSERKFYNRDYLINKLQNTNIPIIREMYNGKVDRKQLLNMIQEKSMYSDSQVEGIYLKIQDENYVIDRCKLVREDFLVGNHWSKNIMIINELIY